MNDPLHSNRREILTAAGVAAAATLASVDGAAQETSPPEKILRIGVISANASGKPQMSNGHTWHFAQGFHPTVNLAAIQKYLSAGPVELFGQPGTVTLCCFWIKEETNLSRTFRSMTAGLLLAEQGLGIVGFKHNGLAVPLQQGLESPVRIGQGQFRVP